MEMLRDAPVEDKLHRSLLAIRELVKRVSLWRREAPGPSFVWARRQLSEVWLRMAFHVQRHLTLRSLSGIHGIDSVLNDLGSNFYHATFARGEDVLEKCVTEHLRRAIRLIFFESLLKIPCTARNPWSFESRVEAKMG
jgi:hypothetical protein